MEQNATKSAKLRSHTTGHLLAALALLLVSNVVMAIVLLHHAHNNLRTQLSQRMLDIGNTAADLVDGDFLGRMQVSDVGSAEYQTAMHTLRIFQENIELSYIYAVRARNDGSYIFLIDPDPDDPAPFGYEVVYSEALRSASRGTPAVQDTPTVDRWGSFYTAYTPVYDAQGNVAGIIGVDYDSGLYKSHQVRDFMLIAGITAFSMILGAALSVLIARRNHRCYEHLIGEIRVLDDGFEKLNGTMMESARVKLQERAKSEQNDQLKALASGEQGTNHIRRRDECSDICEHLKLMQMSLGHYISYLDSQTFIDPLTGIGNKAAYKRTLESIAEEIQNDTAQFAVGFFDINGLKQINTDYGFEVGDTLLYETASILKKIFQQQNVYRVASDEFIVIMKNRGLTDMDAYFHAVTDEAEAFNKQERVPAKLSLSRGSAVYHKGQNEDYRKVFTVAEEAQRRDKAAYYAAMG